MLDHSKVRAPYVRLAGRYQGAKGDEVRKFDLRLTQPNQAALPTDAIHTMEHLLAGYIRETLSADAQVIDASPMGCRTGFYLTVLGEASEDAVLQAFREALEAIASYNGAVPGDGELECGNYRDHSLSGARQWAQQALDAGIVIQDTITLDT